MDKAKRKKVLVAMSGGVDSSVAAALLKKQGYEVIGATMQIWPSKKAFGGCCSLEAVEDAKKVADQIGIPHYTLNFREAFKNKVIKNFIEEYKNGRTPNPCIRCNQYIKFDHLVRKANELDCEYVATGHYARIKSEMARQARHPSHPEHCRGIGNTKSEINTKFELLKGIDPKKDQAYVLYMMNQENLAHTLYPLGDLTKAEVRKLAKKFKLPVHDKEESQEICFIEDDDYGRFLREVYPEAVKPGPILDKDGNIVGMHGGIAFYTLGQRKGVGHHQGLPKYVVQIDREKNMIVIGDQEDTLGSELVAEQVSYVSGQAPKEPLNITAKIRYNSPEAAAMLSPLEDEGQDEDKARVVFAESQRAITPGQSVVFYKGEEVIGGGIIS